MILTSYSQRERYASCEQKWYYGSVERLERSHKGLARFMGEAFSEALNLTNKQGFDAAGKFIESFYADLIVRFPESESDLLNQMTIIDTYSELYGELYDDLTLVNAEREVEFNVALSDDVESHGYLDGLTQSYVVEDKLLSTMSWSRWSADHLLVDEQVTAYIHAAKTLFDVDRLKYRVFIKPGIRLKRGESENEFRFRLRETVLAAPEKYVLEFSCSRTARELDAWQDRVLRTVEQQQQLATGSRLPERNYHACISKYGGCEFFEKCHGLDTEGIFSKRPERSEENK